MSLKYDGKVIARNIVYCDSFLKKATGLMFRSKSSVKDSAWIFTFKKSSSFTITMFFVFFPIDVILLDKNNKVIGLIKNLKPFRNYSVNIKTTSFIELKQGSISKFNISIGKKISIVNK
jgi:hypothetical protein